MDWIRARHGRLLQSLGSAAVSLLLVRNLLVVLGCTAQRLSIGWDSARKLARPQVKQRCLRVRIQRNDVLVAPEKGSTPGKKWVK